MVYAGNVRLPVKILSPAMPSPFVPSSYSLIARVLSALGHPPAGHCNGKALPAIEMVLTAGNGNPLTDETAPLVFTVNLIVHTWFSTLSSVPLLNEPEYEAVPLVTSVEVNVYVRLSTLSQLFG